MSTTETAAADPVIALVAERFLFEERAEADIAPIEGADDDEVAEIDDIADVAGDRIARLDDRIAATVATSTAGLIAQVRVLLELGCGVHSDMDDDHDGTTGTRLADTIARGIERLAGGNPSKMPF